MIPSALSWCILMQAESILRLSLSTTRTRHSGLAPARWLCRITSVSSPVLTSSQQQIHFKDTGTRTQQYSSQVCFLLPTYTTAKRAFCGYIKPLIFDPLSIIKTSLLFINNLYDIRKVSTICGDLLLATRVLRAMPAPCDVLSPPVL